MQVDDDDISSGLHIEMAAQRTIKSSNCLRCDHSPAIYWANIALPLARLVRCNSRLLVNKHNFASIEHRYCCKRQLDAADTDNTRATAQSADAKRSTSTDQSIAIADLCHAVAFVHVVCLCAALSLADQKIQLNFSHRLNKTSAGWLSRPRSTVAMCALFTMVIHLRFASSTQKV